MKEKKLFHISPVVCMLPLVLSLGGCSLFATTSGWVDTYNKLTDKRDTVIHLHYHYGLDTMYVRILPDSIRKQP